MEERANQLYDFFSAEGRLPSLQSRSIYEAGLFYFLLTIEQRHAAGSLNGRALAVLESVPGALPTHRTGWPAGSPGPAAGPPSRGDVFEGWLVRAETYTANHGYRPMFHDDNALYQWLNRARRKLGAGELENQPAARVKAVLDFPDIRTYRYRAAHEHAAPAETRNALTPAQ